MKILSRITPSPAAYLAFAGALFAAALVTVPVAVESAALEHAQARASARDGADARAYFCTQPGVVPFHYHLKEQRKGSGECVARVRGERLDSV